MASTNKSIYKSGNPITEEIYPTSHFTYDLYKRSLTQSTSTGYKFIQTCSRGEGAENEGRGEAIKTSVTAL